MTLCATRRLDLIAGLLALRAPLAHSALAGWDPVPQHLADLQVVERLDDKIVHPGAQKAVEAASGAEDAPKPSPDDLAPAEPEAPSPEPETAE